MKFSESLQTFYLARIADGKSKHTINIYKWGLIPLCQVLGDPDVTNITTQDLRRYMASVIESNRYSVSSLKMIHRCIGAYYTWAVSEGLIDTRPDRLLKKPTGLGQEVQPFTLEEVEKLIKGCDYTKIADTNGSRRIFQMRRSTAKRDRAILLLLLDTGLRVGELSRLLVSDADLQTGELHVRPYLSGLKSRPRTVPLGAQTRKALWRYLSARDDCKASDSLFASPDNRPLSAGAIQRLVRNTGQRAGVANCHPHRFRHTFAIQYLRNGGDVFTLKRILGHSTLKMVEHYLSLIKDDLESAHRRASPVDNWRL